MQTIYIDPRTVATLNAWSFIGGYFQAGGELCEECPHMDPCIQAHPYGEGVAHVADPVCRLGDRLSAKPEQCPAYADHLNELADDPTEASST